MKGLGYIIAFLLIGIWNEGQAQSSEAPIMNGPVLVTFAIKRTEDIADSRFVGYQLQKFLQNAVNGKYSSSFSTLYKVVPSYAVTEFREVEMVDRRVYADVDMYARIRGFGFYKDSVLCKYSATGSGDDEKAAVQKAVNSLLADNGPVSQFTAILDSLFDDRYRIHGMETLEAIKGIPQTTTAECDHVLLELSYFNGVDELESPVQEFKGVVLSKRSELFCKNELPALRIKVETTVYDLMETVNKLFAVSPASPCGEEVLALASLIGEQQQAKAKSTPQELNVLISIHQNKDIDLWKMSN